MHGAFRSFSLFCHGLLAGEVTFTYVTLLLYFFYTSAQTHENVGGRRMPESNLLETIVISTIYQQQNCLDTVIKGVLFLEKKQSSTSPSPPTTNATFSFKVGFIVVSYRLLGQQNNFSELKQQWRWRVRKRHLKREFVLPQILSFLFYLA